mgnify:CR=1 FL=1
MTTPKTTRKTRTPAGSAAIKTKKIVKRVKLPPNPFIHEILDHVEEQKTKAKKIAAVGTDHTSLRREWKHLYNFVKGGNDSLNALRRETMFIQMLEGLHPEEAKIICLVKDKNLTEKYKITKDMVAEAFPDIRWSDRV